MRREFSDANGRSAAAGEILHLLKAEHSAGGHTLSCIERNVRLSRSTPDFEDIVENAGNGWFQPVPPVDWLKDLWEMVEGRLCAAEDLDEDNELLEPIRKDVEESKAWLTTEGERGPAPECTSAAGGESLWTRQRNGRVGTVAVCRHGGMRGGQRG